MKLLPKASPPVRPNTQDSLGHGMDAVIVIMIFFGGGFVIDRILGTTPVFMIALTVLGCIGLFAKFRYQYEAKMDQHEADRLAKLGGPAAGTTTAAKNGEAA